tara:strand:+ start:40324 stop:40602 length:279 start_codon:yes stop_codon:yes gene_type:complete
MTNTLPIEMAEVYFPNDQFNDSQGFTITPEIWYINGETGDARDYQCLATKVQYLLQPIHNKVEIDNSGFSRMENKWFALGNNPIHLADLNIS